ncbi:MAG: Stk1 family PASTA domain-containing Ser/Thr kinase [Actinomycetota bacterium]|jgi:serine/threonine-protein kinase|nr:Stk1 family PASTA domain-containing Ser/Thr kinase [Actinomycetota bacterium]
MDPIETPRVFSARYELNHLIARGGMAEVYRAHDRLLDRPVALKVLFPELSVDRSFVERFRREAQAAANLSHPNIVPVFDWGEDSGTYFIVMEFVDGRPLSSVLKTAGPLSSERAADIASHVAAALGYAHRHGVIHRDVKPGNVLITDEGQVKVTDFGIARAVNTDESLTQTGAVMGTAAYFSPEQAEGMGVDSRSDIYSLGVVLFEMVCGRAPFLGDSPVAVASKHVRDIAPVPRDINPSVAPALEAIILKAMAKNPDHRYATADELRADLLRFTEGRSVLAVDQPTTVNAPAGTTMMLAQTGATQAIPAQGGGGIGAVGAIPVDDPGFDGSGRRSRTRTYVIVLIVLLLLLAVVGVLLARSLGYLGGSASFPMPSVVGEPISQASTTLRSDGLVVGQRAVTSKKTPGTVLSAKPGAGTPVKKGEHVTLAVARAPAVRKVTVPPVTDTTKSNAEQLLSQVGLKHSVRSIPNNQASGTVLSASPSPGSSVPVGSTVDLTVSSGPGQVVVPNVSEETPAQASANLTAKGLTYGGQTNQPSSTVGNGLVIGTTPAAGTSVNAGSSVTIIVSTGPSQVVVQDVVGDSQSAATQALQGQGLTVSSSPAPASACTGSSPGAGNVAAQSPVGGTTVSSGSTVTISVCPSSTTPSSTTTTTTAGGGSPPGSPTGGANAPGSSQGGPSTPGHGASTSAG